MVINRWRAKWKIYHDIKSHLIHLGSRKPENYEMWTYGLSKDIALIGEIAKLILKRIRLCVSHIVMDWNNMVFLQQNSSKLSALLCRSNSYVKHLFQWICIYWNGGHRHSQHWRKHTGNFGKQTGQAFTNRCSELPSESRSTRDHSEGFHRCVSSLSVFLPALVSDTLWGSWQFSFCIYIFPQSCG